MTVFNYNSHTRDFHKQVSIKAFIFFVLISSMIIFIQLKPLMYSDATAKDKYFFDGESAGANNGYVKKVNNLLQRYIENHHLNDDNLNPVLRHTAMSRFSFKDSTMTFYLPEDGDINGLRLISINKFDTAEDSLFYYNSKLSEHLALQLQNPEKKIFETKFDSKAGNSILTLKSITIDENILSVPLISDNLFWRKDVKCSTEAIFKDFLFVKMANVWLPLGSLSAKDFGTQTASSIENVDFYKEKDQFKLIKNALLHNTRMYDVQLGDGKILHLYRSKDTLYFYAQNMGDIDVLVSHHKILKPVRTGNISSIALNSNHFEFNFKNLAIGAVSFTKENPFNDLSYIVHHNHNDFRYAVNENVTDLFTAVISRKIPEIENIFFDLNARKNDKDYQVTLNPVVSKYIEVEMSDYMKTNPYLSKYYNSPHKDSLVKMGVTLMNAATAEIIAVPWVDKKRIKKINYKEVVNYNFENHPIGSCFKPIMMFASYCRFPSLSKLRINSNMISNIDDFSDGSDGNAVLLGYPTKGFNGHSLGDDDLNYALAHSSNLYPVIGFLYSLTDRDPYVTNVVRGKPFPVDLYKGYNGNNHSLTCQIITKDNQLYANRICSNSIIPLIYRQVYNIEDNDVLKNDRDLYDYNYWDKTYLTSYNDRINRPKKKLLNYAILCPERVSLHFDSFMYNVNANPAGNFRNELVPWILGSQNNRWNNVKIAEAFSRLITGNAIRGSFLFSVNAERADPVFDILSGYSKQGDKPSRTEFKAAHLDLLKALNFSKNHSQAMGSWKVEGQTVANIKIPGIMDNFVMLAKTGTADDETITNIDDIRSAGRNRTVHRGEFMFCIMTEKQFNQLLKYVENGYDRNLIPPKLGITGVISLELNDDGGQESKIYYSKYAKEFLLHKDLVKDLIILNRQLFE